MPILSYIKQRLKIPAVTLTHIERALQGYSPSQELELSLLSQKLEI